MTDACGGCGSARDFGAPIVCAWCLTLDVLSTRLLDFVVVDVSKPKHHVAHSLEPGEEDSLGAGKCE